jgi:hypothetical protein
MPQIHSLDIIATTLLITAYMKTAFPSIPVRFGTLTAACKCVLKTNSAQGGDSGELVAEACRSGVAHPPGYPSFIFIYSAWLSFANLLVPGLSAAKAANHLGIALAAVSGLLVASSARCATRLFAQLLPPEWKSHSQRLDTVHFEGPLCLVRIKPPFVDIG